MAAFTTRLIRFSLMAGTMMLGTGILPSGALSQSSPPPETASQWPGGTWTPGEEAFGATLDRQISVKMNDGVLLKADVSYPVDLATGERAKGPFPVILTQTPYLNAKPTAGDYFVKRGYIFVTAYVRGTTTSGGDFNFFDAREADDGAQLVEWAASSLENSNGKVALHGGSYAGINQFLTVKASKPKSPVKAMAPTCMGAEVYREPYLAGGIWTQTLNFQRVIAGSMGGKTASTGAAFVKEAEAGGARAYDGAFWNERAPGNIVEKVVAEQIPVLLWSSNNDIYPQSALDLYAYLQNASAGRPVFGPMDAAQKASGRYQIVMGQGGHCENIDDRILLEWYDTWLKDVPTGMQDTSMPVHVHEVSSNRWFNTGTYPPVAKYTRYYLAADRRIWPNKPSKPGRDTVNWAQPAEGSILQFDSPEFKDGASLAGPISASFYASSSSKNLSLTATLQSVDMDGTVTKLSSGTVLGSMAENDPARSWVDTDGTPIRPYGKYTQDKPLVPGEVSRYDFSISSRFAAIKPGSKLRLTVSTQTPNDRCGPRLGLDPCFTTAPQTEALEGSKATLYYGPETESALNLPIVPAKCWASSDNPGIPFWTVDPQLTAAPCQVRKER